MSEMGRPTIRGDKTLARMIGDLRDQREKADLDASRDFRGSLGTPEIRRDAKLREAVKDANNKLHWKAGRLDMVGFRFLLAKAKEGDGRAWKEIRRRERETKW